MSTAGMGNPTPLLGIKRLLSSTPIDPNPEDYLSRIADAVEEALTTSPYEVVSTTAVTPATGYTTSAVRLRKHGKTCHMRVHVAKNIGNWGNADNFGTLNLTGLRPDTTVFGAGIDNTSVAQRTVGLNANGSLVLYGANGVVGFNVQRLHLVWLLE